MSQLASKSLGSKVSVHTPVETLVVAARKQTNIPIKYIHFDHKNNYSLAEARNRAIVEAEGEWDIQFPRGFYTGVKDQTMQVLLSAGGVGTTGKVNILYR